MKTIQITGFILMVIAFILMTAAYYRDHNKLKCISGAISTGTASIKDVQWCIDTF